MGRRGRRLRELETKAAYLGVSRLQRDHMDQLRQPGDSRCIVEKVVCKQNNSEQQIRKVVPKHRRCGREREGRGVDS